MKKINLEYTSISVLYPDIQWFLKKIERNEPFNFLRVNHGILDQIHLAYENNYKEFEEDYLNKNYFKITEKIINNSSKDLNKLFINYHRNSDKLFQVIYIFIKVLREYKSINDKINISVSLGVGLNTFWGVWHKDHPYQVGRTMIWKTIDKYKNSEFYYSGILKHYSVMGDVFKLMSTLKSKNFMCIFLGANHLKLYKNVFSLNNFTHIEIPQHRAIQHIDEYVFKILNISKKHENVILFHSCGHIMSSYLIHQLNNFNIYTIDIGRSFDNLLDMYNSKQHQIPVCWTAIDRNDLKNYISTINR